jgi:hypothetical protein
MKKYFWNLLSVVIAIIALCFSLWKVTPFDVDGDVFIGTIATFIGVSVTLLIGYQIYNAVELKKDIQEQKKISEQTRQQYLDVSEKIRLQEFVMQEGFDVISTLVTYQKDGSTSSAYAFKGIHHALVSSLNTDRDDYEWLFGLLKKYISDINWQNYCGSMGKNEGGSLIVANGNKNQGRKLSELIDTEFNTQIDEDEKVIRAHKNFRIIKMEYDKVMRLYRQRINEILDGKV